MVSHKKIKEVLQNWGLEKEKLVDVVFAETGNVSESVCYAATAILSESFERTNTDKMKQWIEIYKNILFGYDEVVKLSSSEWKAIPYVVITNQLISTAWFAEQEKYAELYETNKQMTEWMLQNFGDMNFEMPVF